MNNKKKSFRVVGTANTIQFPPEDTELSNKCLRTNFFIIGF